MPDPLSPQDSSAGFAEGQFETLVARYLEGQLDGIELVRLNEQLRVDPARRVHFVEICTVRAGLIEHLKEEEELGRELENELQPESAGGLDLNETMVAPALTDLVEGDEEPDEVPPRTHVAPVRRGGGTLIWKAAAALALVVGLVALVWSMSRPGAPSAVAVAPGGGDPTPAATPATGRAPVSPASTPRTVPAGIAAAAAPVEPDLGRLVQAIDARWDDDSGELIRGNLLQGEPTRGDLLPGPKMTRGMHTLVRGVIRVEFPGGSSVVIQGPSRFEIESRNRIHLLGGRLCARLVHDGTNLTVVTPDMNMVDLGTEFGVEVSPAASSSIGVPEVGQTYLEVFDGRVRAEAPDAAGSLSTRVVSVNEAVSRTTGSDKIADAITRPLAFVRNSEMAELAKADSGPLRRWSAFSQTLRRDPDLTAYYAFDNRQESPGRLINRAAESVLKFDGILGDGVNAASRPRWGPGRLPGKDALEFGGVAGSVVRFPDAAGMIPESAVTLCAWVKRTEPSRPVHFFHGAAGNATVFNVELTGTNGKPAQHLLPEYSYFSWCSKDVPSGAILPSDPEWHLISITSDNSSETKFYIDGELASSVRGVFRKPAPPDRMALGEAASGTEADRRDYLNGSVDELMIFKRVLSESEIRRIYSAGGAF